MSSICYLNLDFSAKVLGPSASGYLFGLEDIQANDFRSKSLDHSSQCVGQILLSLGVLTFKKAVSTDLESLVIEVFNSFKMQKATNLKIILALNLEKTLLKYLSDLK